MSTDSRKPRPGKACSTGKLRLVAFLSLLAAFLLPALLALGESGDEYEYEFEGDDDTAEIPDPNLPHAISIGPIVGGVTHESASVTVRMEGPTNVQVQACESPQFDEPVVASEMVKTDVQGDFTAQLHLEGLASGTWYTLRVLAAGEVQETGVARTFSTAPPPDSTADFQFAVLADAASGNHSDTRVYAEVGDLEPDFVLQIGDLDHRDPADISPVIIDNWRMMYRQQLGEFDQGGLLDRRVLARMPFFHTWDDHDFGADNAYGGDPFKGMSTQAFLEYFPMPADRPNPEEGIWYSFRWAQTEVFMLDSRSQRCHPDDPDDEDKSMLACWDIDDDQKQWLLDGLADSTAVWKFVVSSSVWNPHSKDGDSWQGYQTEQQEILDYIDDHDITGVIVLSGDLHSGGAIDDGTHGGLPELNVPPTNFGWGHCTGECGEWSEGIYIGRRHAGFGLVTVSHDPLQDSHHVTLQALSRNGRERVSYFLSDEDF